MIKECTHSEAWGTDAGACDGMAVGPVGAAARQHASLPVESRWASLVTVKARPSRRAGALTRKWVAATT